MAATYLFFNYNCILVYEIPFSNTRCSIYCSNTPLWKIHGIALINFNFFATDESIQLKISCAIMRCQGHFLKIALGTKLFSIHLKKKENNYPIIFRLPKTSNNKHFDCQAHLKLLKLHRNMGQAVA